MYRLDKDASTKDSLGVKFLGKAPELTYISVSGRNEPFFSKQQEVYIMFDKSFIW